MTTAGERLASLSKLTGVAAASMLLAIGQGANAADALVNYSGSNGVTASERLLYDKASGSGSYEKTQKKRVFINGKAYYLTPKETAEFLHNLNADLEKPQAASVVVSEDKQSEQLPEVEYTSATLNITAKFERRDDYFQQLMDELQRYETELINRLIEQDDEEALLLLI